MKKVKKVNLFLGSLLVATALFFAACNVSTAQLAKEVQQSMVDTWKKEGIPLRITENLSLVHKGGNEYTGLITVSVEGETEQFSVDVTYDGSSFQWRIVE